MNNTIKQLQQEKELKIRSMTSKEIKRYIERTVAYYYSHYMNLDMVYNSSDEIIERNKEDAFLFQDVFNDNLELIMDSIRKKYSSDSVSKQLHLNYVIAILYQSINENIMINHENERKMLQKMIKNMEDSIHFQNEVICIIVYFVTYVNTTFSLLNSIQSMLSSLYLLVSYDVDDAIFDVMNMSFKSLFLNFHINYVSCKCHDLRFGVNELCDGKVSVDDVIESDDIKMLYHDALEKLSVIDDEFLLLVKDDDLFSFPKMILKDNFIDNSIVYDLKQFDIDYRIENDNLINDLFDDGDVSDEYKEMKEFEKKHNVSILFDVGSTDDAINDELITDEISVDDVEITVENIDELEDMLL